MFPIFENPWTSFNVTDDIQIISDIETMSGRTQVVAGDNIKTNIRATTRPLTPREYGFVQAFMKEIRGRGTFTMQVPFGPFKYYGNAVSPDSAFTVNQNYAPGTTIIQLNNTPSSNVVPVGTYVQFRVGGKLHQVISINSAARTITISPSLYESVTINTPMTMRNLVGTYRLKDGVPSAEQQFIYRYALTFDFVEVLP